MSDNYQTCPGCESLIMSDATSCPECGHSFGGLAISSAAVTHERARTPHRKCPQCGDNVPSGLVRCWTCNTFMREDVAEKYKNLVDNPQKIVFSDLPAEKRTETIPPRLAQGGYARILDAAEFTLRGSDPDVSKFELVSADPDSRSLEASTAEASASEVSPKAVGPTEADASGKNTADAEVSADDLLNIAMTQEKEAHVRKRERQATKNRKQILIPCPSCGVWMRVREEQAGRTVRCRGCKTAVPVPQIRRKEKKSRDEPTSQVTSLEWLEDIHLHLIVPTEIALKPGSLQDTFQTADAVFDTEGLHLITLGGAPKKKSLFSRGGSDDVSQNRNENREQIQSSGGFTSLRHGEHYAIAATELSSIRLVQPIRHAHESMFAGVPVFGEGRIVVYLPLKLDNGQQAFCSLSLTLWRQFSRHLKIAGIELPTKANGVPQSELHISPLCHYTQAKVESVRDLVYYKNDIAFELELTGYRCAGCGITISEAGRARNKLGGAAGKSIAKAKCPQCSVKFGNEPIFRISKAPDADQPDSTPPEASSDAV